MSDKTRERILHNWQQVQSDVREAAIAHGRTTDSVGVIGVTKYVDAATTAMLVDAGCTALGENRPQSLWQKAESPELADRAVQWHMIGHVQRNKLRRLIKYRPMIHSVDSERLLRAIADEATFSDPIDVLLEVNISGDDSKTGMNPATLTRLLECSSESLNICGLMAMAGWGTDPDQARNQFAQVRELRDQLATESGLALPHLSMGMSGDFEAAIAEGATMVRIGSRLFEGVKR